MFRITCTQSKKTLVNLTFDKANANNKNGTAFSVRVDAVMPFLVS
jgi:hypothetical protein